MFTFTISVHISNPIYPHWMRTNKLHTNKNVQRLLLVLLSRSRSVSSVPFFPKKDLMSLSSYQLSDGMRSPPTSGWPHIIFEKARKLSLGIAERFSVDRRRRAALMSTKLEREENWKRKEFTAKGLGEKEKKRVEMQRENRWKKDDTVLSLWENLVNFIQ